MVVAESLALGLTGALAGSALGAGIIAVTRSTGIDLAAIARGAPRELSFAGLNVSMRIYPSLALDHVVQGVLAVVVTSIAASAWPAWRAARLQPAQALRA
jgi:ABC-type antimicrobial peptide transport system permease subunit